LFCFEVRHGCSGGFIVLQGGHLVIQSFCYIIVSGLQIFVRSLIVRHPLNLVSILLSIKAQSFFKAYLWVICNAKCFILYIKSNVISHAACLSQVFFSPTRSFQIGSDWQIHEQKLLDPSFLHILSV